MKSPFITLSLLVIFFNLISFSYSKSIVKNLPGFHGELPFTFETGYVGVGEGNEFQFFYYFVESQRDPLHDPLLLYLTGGPGTPALYPFVYQIGNEHGDQPQLNIKGSLIISPLTNKFADFNSRLEFAHRLALISDDVYESAIESCQGNYIDKNPSNEECTYSLQRMDECTSEINFSNILEPSCEDIDTDPTCDIDKIYLESWANSKDVQKALHVLEGTTEKWQQNNANLHYDLHKNDTVYYSYDIFSSLIYHKQLITRSCKVLIMNGDHDMNFPYVGTMGWINSLNLPIVSPWNAWFVKNQVAGYRVIYAKNGYSLMYATVKGAGHSVALYKPEEASLIVHEWLASHSHSSM